MKRVESKFVLKMIIAGEEVETFSGVGKKSERILYYIMSEEWTKRVQQGSLHVTLAGTQ